MRKRQHVLGGLLAGFAAGLGTLAHHPTPLAAAAHVLGIALPVFLGQFVPSIDLEYGTHRETTHNGLVLAAALAFPLVYGNLHWLWVGIAVHYVQDVVGSDGGIALLYPLRRKFFTFYPARLAEHPTATTVTLAWVVLVLALLA